MKWKEKMIETL